MAEHLIDLQYNQQKQRSTGAENIARCVYIYIYIYIYIYSRAGVQRHEQSDVTELNWTEMVRFSFWRTESKQQCITVGAV